MEDEYEDEEEDEHDRGIPIPLSKNP